ncbi:DHHC palmitoyltransferase-domain-containing protein [Mycena metata]|uniref:Palmitoyltransferase n=1 Tax=Mycena metata TaxID=1033252 RepID=A0AAD7IIH8_9AGAR|nr:DHHC palmitoyltransferase-domain-containing protein [Mycena metata]
MPQIRGRPGTRAIEFCIQIFILSVIASDFYIASVEIAINWLIIHRGQRVFGGLYFAAVLALSSSLGFVYVSLVVGRTTHNTPQHLMPDKDDLTEPYECINLEGDLATCSKCDGAWKPPRSHHCSTCGVCRMEFDHHCPWVGNCVTRARMKNFLALLLLTPIACLALVLPVYPTLLRHMSLALITSHVDPWANQVWWDWYGSWIFFGGPLGRWIFGMVLGFRILKTQRKPNLPLIEQPSLRLFVICALGLLLSLFTLTLALWTMKDLVRGLTTLDGMQERHTRNSSRFVCIPSENVHISRGAEDVAANRNKIAAVLPEERLYDLGTWSNLWDILERPWQDQPSTALYKWPQLNPTIIDRIRKTKKSIPSDDNSVTETDN